MRNLEIPTVTDRIIQQAIFQVISPIFEKQFNDNSFGFRPGRSCEKAVVKALEYLNDGYEWIVEIDLEKFFDTVNAEKSKVTRPTQTKYLGFSFWKSPKGQWKPKPHLKSYQRLIRKLKQLTDRSWSISLGKRIKKINYVVRGWVNYFRIANMKNKITEIDEHLRVRIRVIIWKQWKKTLRKYKALRQLGLTHELAFNCANTRKGYYQICKTRYIQFAINNERLRKRGLVLLHLLIYV